MKDMVCVTLTAPQKLSIGRAPVPVPAEDEVLIKVLRCGVCGSDPTIYRGNHPYVSYPVVMGHEFSGTVEAVGANITHVAKGDRVTVIPHLVCGHCEACQNEIYNFCQELRCTGAEADGAHCEYKCMPGRMVLPIPDSMSLDDGALVEPACVAYHGAKRASIRSGDRVLVVGAGPIGNLCMQSCKALGAKQVFIADMDPWRLGLALESGADGVINVGEESLTEGLTRLTGDPRNIDVFYDCVGEKGRVFNNILEVAKRGARIVIVGVLQNGYEIPLLPDFVQHELSLFGTTMYTPGDYREMIELMGRGVISTKGFLTQRFSLTQLPEVFDLIMSRREPFFKIMIDIGEEDNV